MTKLLTGLVGRILPLPPLLAAALAAPPVFAQAAPGPGTTQSASPAGGAASAEAPPRAWSFTVGGGVGVQPIFEGASEVKASPLPIAEIRWRDRVFLSTMQGLGAIAVQTERLTLGAAIGPGPSRDADDADRTKGLGDVDMGVAATVFGSYAVGPVSAEGALTRDFGDSNGLTATIGVGTEIPVTPLLSVGVSVGTTWADEEHMQSFFGVNSAQASRSKAKLKAFDAGAGFKSVEAGVSATLQLSERWTLNANAGAAYLLGDAADSPITQRRFQPSAMAGLMFRF